VNNQKPVMHNPISVANYFIQKSLNDGTELTPMKLVKLVYIAHGWHLALNAGQPLLTDGIQAWKYGPVVPKVYHAFKKYENSRIPCLESVSGEVPMIAEPALTAFLDKIHDVYKKFNGLQLSTLTHQPNTPWDIVWNQQNGKSSKSVIIPNDIIRAHYEQKIAEQNVAIV
jgi:uncharacterized phage-associated protein